MTTPSTDQFRFTAGCIITNPSASKVLLVKGISKWGFPKGHVEEGEQPFETAVREVYEETGLRVTVNIDEHVTLGGNNMYYYASAAECVCTPIDTDEIMQVRWIPLTDLYSWSRPLANYALNNFVYHRVPHVHQPGYREKEKRKLNRAKEKTTTKNEKKKNYQRKHGPIQTTDAWRRRIYPATVTRSESPLSSTTGSTDVESDNISTDVDDNSVGEYSESTITVPPEPLSDVRLEPTEKYYPYPYSYNALQEYFMSEIAHVGNSAHFDFVLGNHNYAPPTPTLNVTYRGTTYYYQASSVY